jgi:transketolase
LIVAEIIFLMEENIMPLSKQEWLALEKKAHELRKLCLQTTAWAGSGHI